MGQKFPSISRPPPAHSLTRARPQQERPWTLAKKVGGCCSQCNLALPTQDQPPCSHPPHPGHYSLYMQPSRLLWTGVFLTTCHEVSRYHGSCRISCRDLWRQRSMCKHIKKTLSTNNADCGSVMNWKIVNWVAKWCFLQMPAITHPLGRTGRIRPNWLRRVWFYPRPLKMYPWLWRRWSEPTERALVCSPSEAAAIRLGPGRPTSRTVSPSISRRWTRRCITRKNPSPPLVLGQHGIPCTPNWINSKSQSRVAAPHRWGLAGWF